MRKAIINIIIIEHMLEERFKSEEREVLQAKLIKVSPFQAGKKSTNSDKLCTSFHHNQRMMGRKA
jgi:hypothetical protein